MFEVTPEAGAMIDELAAKASSDDLKVTIFSSGVGCGGPALKVDMRKPMEDDIVKIVDGHTFHIRAMIYYNLRGAVIEAVDTYWGKRIHVKTTYSCMG